MIFSSLAGQIKQFNGPYMAPMPLIAYPWSKHSPNKTRGACLFSFIFLKIKSHFLSHIQPSILYFKNLLDAFWGCVVAGAHPSYSLYMGTPMTGYWSIAVHYHTSECIKWDLQISPFHWGAVICSHSCSHKPFGGLTPQCNPLMVSVNHGGIGSHFHNPWYHPTLGLNP